MRLTPIIDVTYRCYTCGETHRDWPETPCCAELHERDRTLMTPDEIADDAQVSKATVMRWINAGTLPALREGSVVRVSRADWQDFVAN